MMGAPGVAVQDVASAPPGGSLTPSRQSEEGRAREAALRRLAQALQRAYQLCPDLPVQAIPWMHLRHPLGPLQETLLRAEPGATFGRHRVPGWRLPPRMVRSLLFGGYLSFWLFRVRHALRRELRALRQARVEVVARTCCFGAQRPTDGVDFYFGDLQHRLAERGIPMLLLCGDSSDGNWLSFARRQVAVSEIYRLPEWALVHPVTPLRMAGQQLRTCLRLRWRIRGTSDPLVRQIAELASLECLSQTAALTGLLNEVARAAVRTWRPRAFLTLYEGAAWESCLWRGAKAADPACRTVGYQHTAVFRESLAMLAPAERGPWFAPDVVLGLGMVPLRLLQAGHARPQTRMVRFGSFRYRALGAESVTEPARRTVLVVPEGIASEIRTLFAFAAACARRLPTYTFILRCHPQIPMAQARAWVAEELAGLPNVLSSECGSIDDDFRRASVLLYRGSSSVMYGVAQGLLPVYQYVERTVDRDPLYELTAWRRRCATPEEFAELLERHERAAPQELAAEWEAAAKYVHDYTGPVTDANLQAFVEAAGLPSGAR